MLSHSYLYLFLLMWGNVHDNDDIYSVHVSYCRVCREGQPTSCEVVVISMDCIVVGCLSQLTVAPVQQCGWYI